MTANCYYDFVFVIEVEELKIHFTVLLDHSWSEDFDGQLRAALDRFTDEFGPTDRFGSVEYFRCFRLHFGKPFRMEPDGSAESLLPSLLSDGERAARSNTFWTGSLTPSTVFQTRISYEKLLGGRVAVTIAVPGGSIIEPFGSLDVVEEIYPGCRGVLPAGMKIGYLSLDLRDADGRGMYEYYLGHYRDGDPYLESVLGEFLFEDVHERLGDPQWLQTAVAIEMLIRRLRSDFGVAKVVFPKLYLAHRELPADFVDWTRPAPGDDIYGKYGRRY